MNVLAFPLPSFLLFLLPSRTRCNIPYLPMIHSFEVTSSMKTPLFSSIFGGRRRQKVFALLTKHFGRSALHSLTISERKFPIRVRADLQRAVESLLGESK